MPRRPVRNVFLLGVLVGLVVALVRAATRDARPAPARPLPTPAPSLPARTPQPAPVVVADRQPVADAPPTAPPVPAQAPAVETVVEVAVPVEQTPHPHVAEPEPIVEHAGPLPDEPTPAWVAPVEGACPDGYPIKLKLSSGIFHRPGGLSYERTVPDRCYADEAAAAADGYRAAKR